MGYPADDAETYAHLQAEPLGRAVGVLNRVGLEGGRVREIRFQVVNNHTGFLVNTSEGAAHRIRYLREYLTLMPVVTRGGGERLIGV